MDEKIIDLVIVGGGAAGLATAIFAAQAAQSEGADLRIVVLDGAKQLGAKILVSGGARCNVTHHEVRPVDYNGSQNIIRNILAAFSVDDTVEWFESMNVELKQEPTGKLFPVADTSRAVVAALLKRCAELNIELLTDHRVHQIILPSDDFAAFSIVHSQGITRASRVVMCTGGKSLPRTGSDGGGWEILKTLGHTVTPSFAALVPLVLAPTMFHGELSGIAQDVELSTFVQGKRIDYRAGSLLWTHFGISGPVVMDASRFWTIAQETGQKPQMKCNFFPGEDFDGVERWMVRSLTDRPRAAVLTHLSTHASMRLPERVALCILRQLSIDSATPACQLSRDARRAIVHALTGLILPVTQQRGWNYAEVTAGGVPLGEIDFRTMQSRRVPRLYLAGETLDCEGRIGGFNFQWAWATGFVAAQAIAAAISSGANRDMPTSVA